MNRTIRNTDTSYKVVSADGATLGFIHRWEFRPEGAVNVTGERRFRAVPMGQEPANFETLEGAESYIARMMAR
jgi:hypothetical protein